MKKPKNVVGLAMYATCTFILSTTPVYAYLDPGTASIVLQTIIGGVAAGITVISMNFQRLKMWILKRLNKDSDSPEAIGVSQDDES